MARTRSCLSSLAAVALLQACNAGELGSHGSSAVRGRVVYPENAQTHRTIVAVAGKGTYRDVVGAGRRFEIGGLEPGPVTVAVVAVIHTPTYDQPFAVGGVAEVDTVPGATTEMPDLALTQEGFFEVVKLRGLGLEEQLTFAGTPLERAAVNPDGRTALVLTGAGTNALAQVDLATGRMSPIVTPLSLAGSIVKTFDVSEGGVIVGNGEVLLVVQGGDQAAAYPAKVPLDRDRDVRGALAPVRTWKSDKRITYVTSSPVRPSNPDPAGLDEYFHKFRALHYGAPGAGRFLDVDLAEFRPMAALIAAAPTSAGLVYVPFFSCDTPPGVVLLARLVNPACTPEEVADEAAGVARVMLKRWTDREDQAGSPDVLLARIPNAPVSQHFLSRSPLVGLQGAAAGSGFHLLHGGVVTRIDTRTGAIRDVLTAFEWSDTRDMSPDAIDVAPDESALVVVHGTSASLHELPGLARHDLGHAWTARFTADGIVRIDTGLRDYSRSGDLLRDRSARVPLWPAPILLRPDGTEVIQDVYGQLMLGSTTVPETFTPLTYTTGVHNLVSMSADGAWVYYLTAHSGPATCCDKQLFRMALP